MGKKQYASTIYMASIKGDDDMRYRDFKKAKDTYLKTLKIYHDLEKNEVVKSPIEGISIIEILRIDIAEFLMYLSAADGTIDQNEVLVFREITGFKDGIEGIIRHIEDNDIYSTAYESTVPYSMRLAVEAETIAQKVSGQKRATTLPRQLIKLYQSIGLSLIQADGEIAHDERRDYNIYIDTLEDYAEENGF